ncbi:hypothetical protein GCM10009804_17350 [Kribbella hippodromi]|uniref:Uncharacterized protein n=1 Tax=Kribbella hippodromi TaxID=434347 RepID=A0ABN2CM49_9ACTN
MGTAGPLVRAVELLASQALAEPPLTAHLTPVVVEALQPTGLQALAWWRVVG